MNTTLEKTTPTNPNLKRWKWVFVSLGFICFLALFLAMFFLVGLYFYCKPRHELAQTVDLRKLDSLPGSSMRVPLSEISVPYVNALIAAEDPRFFQHDGVEIKEIVRAIWLNYREKEVNHGASTLTQWLVGAVFQDELRRNMVLSIFLAYRIEKEIEKKQILELHIAHTDFGHGYHGIAAAAQGYFGKSPASLNLAEAAALVALIRNPNYRSPRQYPEAAKKARDYVLSQMRVYEYIDEQTLTEARNAPVEVN